MAVRSHITDPTTGRKAEVIDGVEGNALVVATRELKTYDIAPKFFVDANGSPDMNIGVAFGATPDGVYDGADRTLWAATTVIGGAPSFDEINTDHAKNARITVTNNGAINNLDTITITTSATGATALVEDTHWDKEASAALTAASIAAAIDALGHMESADTGTVAHMYTSNTEDIETIVFSGGGMTQSAACVNASLSTNGDTLQFNKGSDLDLSGYVAITGYIYITSWVDTGTKNVEIYGWDVGSTIELGVRVNINDYISINNLNVWQKFTIPLADMALAGLTSTFDGLRIATVDIGAGASPNYFVDYIQVEQTGAVDPTSYCVRPDKGTWLHIHEFTWSIADALDTTLVNASMPSLSYDKILGIDELSSGISYQRIQNGEVILSASIKKLADMIQWSEAKIDNVVCDGTNTFITIRTVFVEPLVLKAEDNDELRLTINDSMSGLLWLRATVGARSEVRQM